MLGPSARPRSVKLSPTFSSPSSGRTTPASFDTSETHLVEHLKRPGSRAEANETNIKVAVRVRPQTSEDISATVPLRFQRVVVRPLPDSTTTITIDASSTTTPTSILSSPPPPSRIQRQSFTYDRAFGPSDGQKDVFTFVEPLIERFIEGFNVTVLAYGQTSSGKSYTMGTDHIHPEESSSATDRLGIIPRAVSTIFDRLAAVERDGMGSHTFQFKNSFVELYNEDLIDLLAGDIAMADRPAVTIREEKSGKIIWTGLREVKVGSANDVMANLRAGTSLRQTSSTDMNLQSSRSHAIFSLVLTQRKWKGEGSPPLTSPPGSPAAARLAMTRFSVPSPSRIPGSVSADRPGTPTHKMSRPGSRASLRPASAIGNTSDLTRDGSGEWVLIESKLHFVDLAGSERLKRTAGAGERMKEGISINAGLHALGNVISALGDPAKAKHATHIPFRDSKLTRLLQDSLGGNAHTLMVACVSPTEINVGETVNTLKYAHRAQNIRNRVEINEVEAGWNDLEHLQNLVTQLRTEIQALHSDSSDRRAISQTSSPVKRVPSVDLLDLQQRYSALRTKHAQVVAELARKDAQHASTDSLKTTVSPEAFAEAVQPVVEEYEKSLQALEAELVLIKAALAQTHEARDQSERALRVERASNVSNMELVGDLRLRISEMGRRGQSADSHVQASEINHGLQVNREAQTEAAVRAEEEQPIQAHVAPHNGAVKSEPILDALRLRLANSDSDPLLVEEVVCIPEAGSNAEAGSSAEAGSIAQIAVLRHALEEREELLVKLRRDLDQHTSTIASLHADLAQLQQLGTAQRVDNVPLGRERTLAQQGPSALAEMSQPSHSSSPSLDPPGSSEAIQLRTELQQLQRNYASTSTELVEVSRKYKDALKELETLARQANESERSDPPDAKAACRPLPLRVSMANDGSPSTVPQLSPIRDFRYGSGLLRRSSTDQNLEHLSFFGRAPSPAVAGAQTHARSASRSSEPSSWALDLRSCLQPLTPLSTSPRHTATTGSHQRSYESLLAEVRQLQDVLALRDDEIATLELRLKTPSAASNDDAREQPPSSDRTELNETTASGKDDGELSTQEEKVFRQLRSHLATFNSDSRDIRDERLDTILRSMARKESAYSKTVADLSESLAHLQKEHESLQALSRDQVTNSSAELERLHTELASAIAEKDLLESDLAELKRQNQTCVAVMASLSAEIPVVGSQQPSSSEPGSLDIQPEHATALHGIRSDLKAALDAERLAHNITRQKLLAVEDGMDSHLADEAKAVALQGDAQEARQALEEALTYQKKLTEQLDIAAEARASEVTRLHEDLAEAVAELERHQGSSDASAAELKEALEALATLEQALLESQDERERLAIELQTMRQTNNAPRRVHEEVAEGQGPSSSQLSTAMSRHRGKSVRISSTDSIGSMEYVDAQPGLASPTSPSHVPPPLAPLQLTMLTDLSTSRPPPTPPPNMPPPPVPSAVMSVHLGMVDKDSLRGERASVVHPSESRKASAESEANTAVSTRNSETASARTKHESDEQGPTVLTLKAQLAHCESDLRANIDLVATLESALNDAERDARRARLQNNDLVRERDSLQQQNDDLRTQADEASRQAESVRQTLLAKQHVEIQQSDATRQAQQLAKDQLDRRIEDMRRKKSKFSVSDLCCHISGKSFRDKT